MVPMTMPAMNGSVEPVKYGMPMLIMTADSMASTRMIGRETERKMMAMMTNTATIEAVSTFLKSTPAIVTRSLFIGASPVISAFSSYFLTMLSIFVSCSFCSSDAGMYLEFTMMSWRPPETNRLLISSGITSDGISPPT